MTDKISGFFDEYRWLSNFWKCNVRWSEIDFPSSEHAYQAAKFDDTETRELISFADTPGKAKRMGSFAECNSGASFRENWPEVRFDVMYEIVKAKFVQNPYLTLQLLDTGNAELIEENRWGDTYWGTYKGKGENNLGKILMQVRDIIHKEAAYEQSLDAQQQRIADEETTRRIAERYNEERPQ